MYLPRALLGASALLFSATAAAVIADPLGPWVSVDASGTPVSTITPVLTTISGTPTTIRAAPTTTTSKSDSKPTDAAPAIGGGSYQVCKNLDGDFKPFCKPDNGSSVWVDNKYYVTWDTSYFTSKNTSLYLIANYVNESEGGAVAFQSSIVGAEQGFYVWDIDKAWMEGHKFNNVTLFLNPVAPEGDMRHSNAGPTVEVTTKPAEYYQMPKTKAPTGQSLYIALPTVFGFILICVIGGCILNRKRRRIGLGNIMGRRKGYGVGKSRMQRLRLGKKGDAILLRERELTSGDRYRDISHREDDDTSGNYPRSPLEERRGYFEGQPSTPQRQSF